MLEAYTWTAARLSTNGGLWEAGGKFHFTRTRNYNSVELDSGPVSSSTEVL